MRIIFLKEVHVIPLVVYVYKIIVTLHGERLEIKSIMNVHAFVNRGMLHKRVLGLFRGGKFLLMEE